MLNLEVISEKKNTYTFFLQSFVACINQQAWFLQACRFAVSFKGSYAWIHLTVDLGMINISPNNLSPWTSALHFALCSVSFLFFFHTHGYTCITIIMYFFSLWQADDTQKYHLIYHFTNLNNASSCFA